MNAPETAKPHAVWIAAYRVLLRALPRALREKHGDAMCALFARDLERNVTTGARARWSVGISGLLDLLRRGAYERVTEERAALAGPQMAVLRRTAREFAASVTIFTALLVAQHIARTSPNAMLQVIALSVPFTLALTIPMAVFVAVLRAGPTVRVVPLVGVASMLALFAFAWNADVVPRTNARLVTVQYGAPASGGGDRTMTWRELRIAAEREESALSQARHLDATHERLAGYRLEIHKKAALAAACLVLALLAAGITRRAPQAGGLGQSVAVIVVFGLYYTMLMGGESLADQQQLSPALAMWGANLLALVVALVALRASPPPVPGSGLQPV
jgi:hypothetical protein